MKTPHDDHINRGQPEVIVSILTASVAVFWFVIVEMVPRFVSWNVILSLSITCAIFWYLSLVMLLVKIGQVVMVRRKYRQRNIRPFVCLFVALIVFPVCNHFFKTYPVGFGLWKPYFVRIIAHVTHEQQVDEEGSIEGEHSVPKHGDFFGGRVEVFPGRDNLTIIFYQLRLGGNWVGYMYSQTPHISFEQDCRLVEHAEGYWYKCAMFMR